jgi:site-specific DNA recombinase
VRRVNADTVKAFCAALKDRFNDPASGLGKAYLRLLVDEIKLDGNEPVVRGSHRRLADAIGFMEKRKLGEVPSFVNDWRARRDSNPRPLASEANTLSSELRARGVAF